MKHINDGGPAYPVHGGYGSDIDDPRNRILGGGLTKREYFAIHIRASLGMFRASYVLNPITATMEQIAQLERDATARYCVAEADALLAALAQGGE